MDEIRAVMKFKNIQKNRPFLNKSINVSVSGITENDKFYSIDWKFRMATKYDQEDNEKEFSEIEYTPSGAKSYMLNQGKSLELGKNNHFEFTLIPTSYFNHIKVIKYESYIPKLEASYVNENLHSNKTQMNMVLNIDDEFLRFDGIQVITTVGQALNYIIFVLVMSLAITPLVKKVFHFILKK